MANNVISERKHMLKMYSDKLPESYYITRREKDKRNMINVIESFNIDDNIILDLGAGNGYIGWLCKSKKAIIILFDIYNEQFYVDENIVGVVGDNSYLPFKNDVFDFIFCDNVLHHGNLKITISELNRVLKDGGIFIAVCEPCIQSQVKEKEILERDCQNELKHGVDEHRPNYFDYYDNFSNHFTNVIIRDAISGNYRGDCDYGNRGISIYAAKQ